MAKVHVMPMVAMRCRTCSAVHQVPLITIGTYLWDLCPACLARVGCAVKVTEVGIRPYLSRFVFEQPWGKRA